MLAVGAALDELLWGGLLRTAPCSEAGGVQLACLLLTLPLPVRAALLAEISGIATVTNAGTTGAVVAGLQAKLEELQIFRLGPAEVKDVLSNLQVDD